MMKRWSDVFWKNTLWDELDLSFISPVRSRLHLLRNGAVNCSSQGKLSVSRKACLRISSESSVSIDSGCFYVGFQLRGGRRMPTFDHTALVVHPGGQLKIRGSVQLCAGSCLSVHTNAVCNLEDGVVFAPNAVISCVHGLSVGSNSVFGWGFTLQDNDMHTIQYATAEEQTIQAKRHCQVQIGSNVWAGHHVTVLKGVTIGDNVILGANSVVTKDIPSETMAVGNPARIIKQGARWSW